MQSKSCPTLIVNCSVSWEVTKPAKMDRSSDDIIKFKLFLEEFTAKHNGPITSDDPLPFRLVTYRLTPEEVEGECIEWVMEYLFGQNNCPPVYAAAIAKATVDNILASDISSFEDERDEEEGKLIEANGFARYVFSAVHRICEEWNASMPSLDISPGIHQISLQAVRNTRRKMEDKHVVLQDIGSMFKSRLKDYDGKTRAFYAVYDGHGGVDASYYAAAHLHLHTVLQPDFLESPTSALKKAFNETDEAFIQKAGREGLRSGSTGLAAVVEPDTIHLAWLGDSQAVLMRDSKPVTIMDPHKPDREDEKKRIEELGGCVVWFGAWRVNGSLAVSRSIGDPDYKPYVSSDADTVVLPLDGTEECLILACDGLWDVVTPEEACDAIRDAIQAGTDLSGLAPKLVTMAKEAGSSDNITVLLVFLNPYWKKGGVKERSREGVVVSGGGGGKSESDSTMGKGESEIIGSGKANSEGDGRNHSAMQGGETDTPDGTQVTIETNVNNNNINRNSGRREHKNTSVSMSSHKKDLMIKNGVNVITKSPQRKIRKASTGRSLQLENKKPSNSPELISDISRVNSMPLVSRRSSINKKGASPLRRSSSTPPVHKRKTPSTGEESTISDLGIISPQTKSGSVQSLPPVQHKSMPISIKPKSLTRTRSLPRDPKLAAVIKNNRTAANQTASPRVDVQR